MTVQEIKEFIDKHTKGNYIRYDTIDFRRSYTALLEIKSMLDQLDSPRYIMDDNGNISRLDNEWVDVRDGLPREYGEYWITDKNGSVGKDYWEQLTDYYEHENFDCWAFSDDDEVIAWKKVEPYERKE